MKPTSIQAVAGALLLLMGLMPASRSGRAEEPSKNIDPKALEIIQRASTYLAAAPKFSVSAEIWEDFVEEDGRKLQFTKIVDVKLRRPSWVQLDVRTSVPKRSFFYNGKSVTMLDQKTGFYGTAEAPGTIDETILAMEEKFGIDFPIDDLLVSKPFGDGAAKASAAQYYGVEPVNGITCHHLAFQNEGIDWQAWVEAGPVPVIRKVVITDKLEKSAPQFTAILTAWDFVTPLPDFVFSFDPPAGSIKVDMIKVDEPEDAGSVTK